MQSCTVYVPASAIDAYKESEWFKGTDVYVGWSYTDYFNVGNLYSLE